MYQFCTTLSSTDEHLIDELLAKFVESVDLYLFAMVLIIFGMGIYELFINKIDPVERKTDSRPTWLQISSIDDLKQSVQNATYEQKDPLVVYKLEAYNLFAAMLEELNQDVLSFLLRAFIPLRDDVSAPRQAQAPRRTDMSQMRTQHDNLSTNGEQKANTPVKVDKRVGRNDPCPCGSGLKYKNCHGKGIV